MKLGAIFNFIGNSIHYTYYSYKPSNNPFINITDGLLNISGIRYN